MKGLLNALLAVKPIDCVIVALAAAIVVGVIAYSVWKKKKGISGCGCGCKTCPSAERCNAKKKDE